MSVDVNLLGKPITQLTPQELAALTSQLASLNAEVEARQKEITDKMQAEQFGKIAAAAKEAMAGLAWAKLPALTLTPNEAGDAYDVAYVVKAVRKAGGAKGGSRAASEPGTGKVTIAKIASVMGGISKYVVGGKEFDGVKDAVKALINPKTTKSEAENCYEISKKGISASDIITSRHAKEVTLVLANGTKLTVEDAIKSYESASKETTVPAAPEAAPAEPPI